MGVSQSIPYIDFKTSDDFLKKIVSMQLLNYISYIRQTKSNEYGFHIRAEELHEPISAWHLKEKFVFIKNPNSEEYLNMLKELISVSVSRKHKVSFCKRPDIIEKDKFQYDIFILYL